MHTMFILVAAMTVCQVESRPERELNDFAEQREVGPRTKAAMARFPGYGREVATIAQEEWAYQTALDNYEACEHYTGTRHVLVECRVHTQAERDAILTLRHELKVFDYQSPDRASYFRLRERGWEKAGWIVTIQSIDFAPNRSYLVQARVRLVLNSTDHRRSAALGRELLEYYRYDSKKRITFVRGEPAPGSVLGVVGVRYRTGPTEKPKPLPPLEDSLIAAKKIGEKEREEIKKQVVERKQQAKQIYKRNVETQKEMRSQGRVR